MIIGRETLAIDVGLDYAKVTADLELDNRGPARSFPVGFPCLRGEQPGFLGLDCRTPIQVTVDGRKVATKQVASGETGEFVWPMSFAAGARPRVRITYRARLRNDNYPHGADGMFALHYRLVTGAEWAGTIGVLDMRVTLPAAVLAYIAPKGYTRSRRVVEWHLRDYEPSTDVLLFFEPGLVGGQLERLEARLARPKGEDRKNALIELQAIVSRVRGDAEEMREGADHVLTAGGLGPLPADADFKGPLEESARMLESLAN